MGKGIVTQPTLWGNLLLGPTARDMHNKAMMAQTVPEITTELLVKCRELIPGFDARKIIHSFAGARAKSTRGDWVIEASQKVAGFVQAAAIDSPGLAGSPAIALEVVKLLSECGLETEANNAFNPYRKPIIVPKNGWKGIKIDHADPEKNVVCKCEKVTEAEIKDAINRSLECSSTQAVRKRTRAGMGHCQGKCHCRWCMSHAYAPRAHQVLSSAPPHTRACKHARNHAAYMLLFDVLLCVCVCVADSLPTRHTTPLHGTPHMLN